MTFGTMYNIESKKTYGYRGLFMFPKDYQVLHRQVSDGQRQRKRDLRGEDLLPSDSYPLTWEEEKSGQCQDSQKCHTTARSTVPHEADRSQWKEVHI